MAQQALFEGLVYDENDRPVTVKFIGGQTTYVVNDDGFLRHIDSEVVDRQVVAIFLEQLQQNKALAIEQALRMMKQDDLFTRAALDSSIRKANVDQIIEQGIPAQAREMMGLVGFRIVIDLHGEVVRFNQPMITDEDQ